VYISKINHPNVNSNLTNILIRPLFHRLSYDVEVNRSEFCKIWIRWPYW